QDLPATTPTGILANRAVPLARIEQLNGRGIAGPVTLPRWRHAVFELQRSAETELPWKRAHDLQRAALSRAGRDEVPLALMYASYDRMLSDGSLRGSEAFTFAPLRERTHYGQGLRFTL